MKLKVPFELDATDVHCNGRTVILNDYKDDEQIAAELTKYCSLRTIVRDLLGNGYKVEEILLYAKEWSEEFEEIVVENESNVPDVFVQIFEQFGFQKAS